MIPLHRIYPGQFSVRNHPILSLHDLFPLQIQEAGDLKDRIRTARNATAMRMDRSHTSGPIPTDVIRTDPNASPSC